MQVKLGFKRKGSEERVDIGASGPADLVNKIISRVRAVIEKDGEWEEI